MDVKEAVATAKNYVVELYTGENITNVGLEEVEFDQAKAQWLVTVGVTRVTAANNVLAQFGGTPRRSYKRVTIDGATGQAISLKDRELAP